MNTLISYLSDEAIENCAICLNYCIDSVIFLSYEDVYKEENENITNFLKKKCRVKNIKYIKANTNNLNELIKLLKENININDDNFIDLTGSDGICQVCLSEIAKELDIPSYLYDVRYQKIYEVNTVTNKDINKIKKDSIIINMDDYIEMVGGLIIVDKNKIDKSNVDNCDNEKLANIKEKYDDKWPQFVYIIQQFKTNTEYLECNDYTRFYNDEVIKRNKGVINTDKIYDKGLLKYDELINILNDLNHDNLIKNFSYTPNHLSLSFKNKNIKDTITEAGIFLEQKVYKYELNKVNEYGNLANDVRVGISLDWDNNAKNELVNNEIDVLRLDGYSLTFISCKDTNKINDIDIYELEVVRRRFGSKYSKMKLVYTGYISPQLAKRAEYIGIELMKGSSL